MVTFFLDTYALMEIAKGNENYRKYLSSNLYTSFMNLYELYHNMLKVTTEEAAQEIFFHFKQFLFSALKDEHLFHAAQFKLKNKKLNFSYVDALGYAIAIEERMKFLTGDRAFNGFDGVVLAR